jgi:hypothetical protein
MRGAQNGRVCDACARTLTKPRETPVRRLFDGRADVLELCPSCWESPNAAWRLQFELRDVAEGTAA